jgi:hypothetical protein
VRFNDADMREALYTGPDAERDARAKWGMMCGPSGTWNGYLFRLAKRSRLSPVTSAQDDAVQALKLIAEAAPIVGDPPLSVDAIQRFARAAVDAHVRLSPVTSPDTILMVDAMVEAWSEADAHHSVRKTCEHLLNAALASTANPIGETSNGR